MTPDTICLDFETGPIKQRPAYPPPPVGLAIRWPRESTRYYAFGHPTDNNCVENEAKAALWKAWDSGLPLLFHNAKFDLAVAYEKLGLPRLTWDRVHDTMFLAFLCDPHAASLGLKPLANKLLGMRPDERDAVHGWIWKYRREIEKATGESVTKKNAGAWISMAPGSLVAPYAAGDVDRTVAIFEYLWPKVQALGMREAYDRERRVLPILMENEERGIRCATGALVEDIDKYSACFEVAENKLRHLLKAPGLNLDADADVADVLVRTGCVLEAEFVRTARGGLSMSKDNLHPSSFSVRGVADLLGYRNRLKTCLDTFMRPWLAQAAAMNGYISTSWNQVRSERGGTRTGRPSTSAPNLLNIARSFEGRDDGYVHPDVALLPLPLCRQYLLPDEGELWLKRDFSGQELRVFAHFEQGLLWQAYNNDAALDPHTFVGAALKKVAARDIPRSSVKIMNFQALYGGGIPALQKKLRCTTSVARVLKVFHDRALPGRRVLNEAITSCVNHGDPIRTWGGRLYWPEKPGSDGRDKLYKLINYLIQGSAADLTKQVMVDWHSHSRRDARFLVQVYDELGISARPEIAGTQMDILREVMQEQRLTISMRSVGSWGPSFGELEACGA